MVSLSEFGIEENGGGGERVAIVVGPNGSGKSNLLLELAHRYRRQRDVTIVCNTPHDRFTGLRRVNRLSVGSNRQSAKTIVKRAVARALNSGSEFYQISSVLKHCGYRPRFGFWIESSAFYGVSYDDFVEVERIYGLKDGSRYRPSTPDGDEDLYRALAFLRRHDPNEPVWIDATGSAFEFSLASEFASVLACETRLRRQRVITDINVYLERSEDERKIEMHHASSGQLALISSLLFLVANVGENPIIIVDEPENSLHPNWQREYVEKVLAAMSYRGATIFVATHAPLVVTGALADTPQIVSVYQVKNGNPQRIDLDSFASQNSIEEILWRAFDVLTPANHFVSEQVVAAVSRFENSQIKKEEVLDLIGRLESESFDDKQKRFFGAVRDLLDKVEVARESRSKGEPEGNLGDDNDA